MVSCTKKRYKEFVNNFKYEVNRARPMTTEILDKIEPCVDRQDGKQVAVWVTMLLGFFLLLRKSNLVPDTQSHDPAHNLTRKDVRFHNNVMVFIIRWTKTMQCAQKRLPLPLVADLQSNICPVRWILHLLALNPAHPSQNLLSYINDAGVVVPVTYRLLTWQMREWLTAVGIKNPTAYSSHSLRRGGTSLCFEKGLSDHSIKTLGLWSSEAFRNYIDVTVEHRVKAWYRFSNL